MSRRANIAAGIWEIKNTHTGERISKFRARRRSDVDRAIKMAEIGLGLSITDIEACYITDWEDVKNLQ